MNTQLTKRSLIALALIAMLTTSAGAAVLHDQSSYGDWGAGFLNGVAGGPMGGTSYSVNDITVGGTGWSIESISIIVNALGGYETNVTTAYVNIFPKTGPLPTDIPNNDLAVPVTVTTVAGNDFMVTASGLAIELEPGEYWVGLTPATADLYDGIHIPSDTYFGDATPSYDPNGFPAPMWANWVPDTDATILLEGDDQVVATESVSMGSVKALFR
jgi:hypothetical protein